MAVEVLTKADLQAFRVQLLEDLRRILVLQVHQDPKKWLKSAEVRNLLGLSAGKLQNLRISGKLPFSRIGGVCYYKYEDIERLLDR